MPAPATPPAPPPPAASRSKTDYSLSFMLEALVSQRILTAEQAQNILSRECP